MKILLNCDKLIEMNRLYLLLPIGIIAVSTASIFIKLCDAPVLIIATYRMALASLVLIPFACYEKTWRGFGRNELGWSLLSGLFLSLHFAFWIASLKYTSVASSVVLVTTHPIFVGLGGWLLLGERLGLNLIGGIALSVLGSGLISYGDGSLSEEALMGDGLALLGAMAASGYLLVGRKMRKDRNLISYIFPVYSSAGLILILLSLIFQKHFFGYSSSTYFYLLLLALVPQLIGHTTFNWALKYLPASMVAVTILGEPIGSTILARLILGEGLTVWKILGGISIFSGILIALEKTFRS
ncbi:MAG TPA: DMT family transporter [Thermodesulfobacteriota bacterium]|nr:DMT family transporter [Thermodesulfobacteriota bacterium]